MDSLDGPTGFAVNGMNIAWSLAKDYDVYYLGLQSLEDYKVEIDLEGETREVIQVKNYPRTKNMYDFGTKSLPIYLDKLEPEILLTINDIQMIQHIPGTMYRDSINVKVQDFPSKKMLSQEAINRQIKGKIQELKENTPDTKWIAYCFTPDTKVMTPDGMRYIRNIDIGDEVYSWNPNDETIEITNVSDTQIHKISEDIVNINHQKVDFSVTKEHLFNLNGKETRAGDLLELSKSQNRKFPKYKGLDTNVREWFEFYKYFGDEYIIRIPLNKGEKLSSDQIPEPQWKLNHSDSDYFNEINYGKLLNPEKLVNNFTHTYAKSKPRNGTKIPLRVKYKDFMSLAGWYISEGYLDKHTQKICGSDMEYTSYRVCISQENETNREKITNLLDRMDINYYKRNSTISINGEFYYKLFNTLFHDGYGVNSAKDKYIPKILFNESCLEYLFVSLMDGDGHWDKRKNSVGSYYTSSEQLKDDFVTLCFLLGYHPGVHYDGNKYTITVSKSETQPIINGNHISTEKYNGYVYDITLEKNNYFFAGRNDKYVITHNCPQDGDPPMPQWNKVYSMADKVVAMSKYGQDVFKKYYGMDTPYIWHGVDSAVFKPSEKPDHIKDKFVVGDFNRNQPRKQTVRPIQAFAKFAKDKDDVLIHLQKDWGDEFGWPLKYFTDIYGVTGKCIKPGKVGMSREDVARVYNAWDVNLMCTGGEGFGLAFAESMMCGVPNIANDYTTSKELVDDGWPRPRGQLTDYELIWQKFDTSAVRRSIVDLDSLVDSLNTYYYDRELLEKHSENARKWAKKNLAIKNQQQQWRDLIKETLNEG